MLGRLADNKSDLFFRSTLMTRRFESVNASLLSLSSSPGGCRLTTKPGMANEGECVFCLQTQTRKVNFRICLNGTSLCITSALRSFAGVSLLSFPSVEGGGGRTKRKQAEKPRLFSACKGKRRIYIQRTLLVFEMRGKKREWSLSRAI